MPGLLRNRHEGAGVGVPRSRAEQHQLGTAAPGGEPLGFVQLTWQHLPEPPRRKKPTGLPGHTEPNTPPAHHKYVQQVQNRISCHCTYTVNQCSASLQALTLLENRLTSTTEVMNRHQGTGTGGSKASRDLDTQKYAKFDNNHQRFASPRLTLEA